MDTRAVQQYVRGAFLAFLLVSCSDHSFREKLVLADSLSATNADSSLVILNELRANSPSLKESDRLYFDLICHSARTENYLRNAPNDTLLRALLQEQERILTASSRRSGRVVATLVAVLLGLLLVVGMSAFRFALRREERELDRQRQALFAGKRVSQIAASPETMAMRRLCSAAQLPTDDDWVRFQTMIDSLSDGFSHRLLSAHKLSEQELRVCLLIKVQFKPSEIALLTAHSKEAITSTRRRLYKKMTGLDGVPEMLDELILRV